MSPSRGRFGAGWLGILAALIVLAGCAPHHAAAPEAEQGTAPSGGTPRGRTSFAVDGRVESGGRSRRMKMRFFASAPDSFRMEIRGSIGGIVLVATGREGRVRVVLPKERRYAESAVVDDLGSGLIGLPLSGCDLAMVMRISSGMKRFQPCEPTRDDPSLDEPPTEADRPEVIVDTSASGVARVRYGFDWSGGGPFPREVRVELPSESGAMLALSGFKSIDYPDAPPSDFFWEPVPAGAVLVPSAELAGDTAL